MEWTHRQARSATSFAVLLTLAGLLSACGGSQSAASDTGDPDGSGSAASALDPNSNGGAQQRGDTLSGLEVANGSPSVSGANGSPSVDARKVLATALAEADRTKRLVFLHSGASW